MRCNKVSISVLFMIVVVDNNKETATKMKWNKVKLYKNFFPEPNSINSNLRKTTTTTKKNIFMYIKWCTVHWDGTYSCSRLCLNVSRYRSRKFRRISTVSFSWRLFDSSAGSNSAVSVMKQKKKNKWKSNILSSFCASWECLRAGNRMKEKNCNTQKKRHKKCSSSNLKE